MGDFHNPEGDIDRFRFRVGVTAALVVFCFGLLLARFVWLQVIQHDFYQTRAEDNRIALIPIVPNRGVITDRKGVVLAHNYSAFTLEITPSQTIGLEETIDGLAEVIEIQTKELGLSLPEDKFAEVLACVKDRSVTTHALVSDDEFRSIVEAVAAAS